MSGRKKRELINVIKGLNPSVESTLFATVVRVNDNDTVDVTYNDLEIKDVRLRAVINSNENKIVVYPEKGSYVMITRINRSAQFFVESVAEVDKVVLSIGKQKLQVTRDGFVYNKGKHTTANADVLKTELNKLTKRVDDLLKALVNAAPDSAAGTFKASLLPQISAIVNKENWGGIENEEIKH